MGTVTFGGTEYTVNGSLTGAVSYLAASMHATAWNAITVNGGAGELAYDNTARTRSIALVTATRWLDTLSLDSDVDGYATAIANATYELAAALVANPQLAATPSGKNVKSISTGAAGGHASVQFWAPQRPGAGGLPSIVARLLGPYLSGASGAGVPYSGGDTDEESKFDDCDAFDVSEGV